ncbi:MAG: prolyl oligopeptidase family serine peptidase [Gemmatimonadota bacterium]
MRPRRLHAAAPAALALAFLLVPSRTQSPDRPGALPYDLAFAAREFLWSTAVAVSADGNRVAYEVRQPPADQNLSARFLPSGTPTSVVGSKVYITDRATGRTTEVSPGGSCWRAAWSPNGQALAFYSDAGGPPQLWVYDLTGGRSRKLSAEPIKAKLWAGDEPRWSPTGDVVYVPVAPPGEYRASLPAAARHDPNAAGVTVLKSGRELDSTPNGGAVTPLASHMLRENLATLAAVDVRSGGLRVVVPAETNPKPSVLRVSPSGRWLSYLSVFKEHGVTNQVTTFDLAVVPAAGGPVRIVAEDLPTLDDYHRLNYSWHPTGDRLVYFKNKRLWLVDVGPEGPAPSRPIGTELGDLAPTIYWFTRDGRSVVVGTKPQDDKGYGEARPRGIAVIPLDGSTPAQFALDDAAWLYRGILKADERTIWQPDGSSVTLLLEERATGKKGVVRFEPRTGTSTVLWKGVARLGNLTGGGGHDALFGTFEDLGTPPNIYRFPADFSARERISHLDPRLDQVAAGTAEIFETTVPMYDGRLGKVRTAVLLPAGVKRGDRPPGVVLMYPGSDVSRTAEQFGGGTTLSIPTLLLTSRGYAVILADLTLGPNREAGNPMQEMVDVLLPQVYHAAELGYVDGEHLGLGGQSFGGFGTAAVISRTNLFRAAVAVSGIYDLPGTYGHMDNEGGSFWIGWSEGGQARMGTHPWANLKRYVDNSPYYQADKIFTPLLIVHGDADMAYDDGQKLFTALRRLERPALLASYAGQGHVIYEWRRPSAIDAAQRIVEFYRKHPGDPAAERRAGGS